VAYQQSQILPADVAERLQLEISSTLYVVDADGDLGNIPGWISIDSQSGVMVVETEDSAFKGTLALVSTVTMGG